MPGSLGSTRICRFVPDADTLRRVDPLTIATSAGKVDVLARPPKT